MNHAVSVSALSAAFAVLAVRNWLKRREAIAVAEALTEQDRLVYENLWYEMKRICAAELDELNSTYTKMMESKAIETTKRQPMSIPTVEALFHACDMVNLMFLHKVG